MKNSIYTLFLLFFSLNASAQIGDIIDISGTWNLEGDATQTFTINQNQQYLTFIMSNSSANGYFTAANQLYATEWEAYGNLSADGNKITWSNQVWVRSGGRTTQYPDISGKSLR